MERYQYKCIEAARREVDGFISSGYKMVSRFSCPGGWWYTEMKHPNGNMIVVEMSPNRDCLKVFKNQKQSKCLSFDV